MAAPIDPELMAKLQAQGWLDQSQPVGGPKPPPMAHEAAPVNAFSTDPGIGEQSGREQAIRKMLTSPITPMRVEGEGGAGGKRAEGVFNDAPGAAPGAVGREAPPQWQMPATKATPGGWQSTVSTPTLNEYNMAMHDKAQVPILEATAQDTANQKMAGLYDQQSEALGKQMFAEDAARKQRTKALDAQMADYKRLQEEAAEQKEDPGRWWGNKSAGEKALGIIGIILGGFAAAAGQENPALKLMNTMIDRDVASQKANIAQKGKKAEAAMNMYGQKVRQFGDENAADLATRAQMLEQFKLQSQSEALRSQSPVLMARAKDLGSQIELEQAKLHQGLEHWQKGGIAGGITEADQKRAFELYKSGMIDPKTGAPIEMNSALQAALSLRGAAPMKGLPTLIKGGKGAGAGKADKEDLAAARLEESSKNAPESLGAWDRVTAGASHIPGIGPLFGGTEGARKEQAINASNVPIYGYAHVGLGMRRTQDMEHAAGSLMIQPRDTQDRINQKMALRALVARGQMNAIEAAKKLNAGGGGSDEKSGSSDEDDK